MRRQKLDGVPSSLILAKNLGLPIFLYKLLNSQNRIDGCPVFIFTQPRYIQQLFPIPLLPPPAPHPPSHQYQHQYNPWQPDPVELGEDHRLTSGCEVGLQLEGGDPDHLPGGEEALVTPRPEPANPLAAGGEGIEQAVGEQRNQQKRPDGGDAGPKLAVKQRGQRGQSKGEQQGVGKTAVAKDMAIGNPQFKGEHIGIGQHGDGNPRQQQARRDNPAAKPEPKAERNGGVSDDGWHRIKLQLKT